jgi:glycosyltransferase involved in cell wall biosynthesis
MGNKPLKLLFVIDHLGSGGAQRQMVTLARTLSERNHKIDFFIYHPEYNHFEEELLKCGIRILKIERHNRYSFSTLQILRKYVKCGQYDLVLSFLYTPNLYAELSLIGMKSIPLVVSMRSVYPNGRVTLQKYLLEQFHRFADIITVNSVYQKELMVRKHHWMNNKLRVIYNGVDLNLFRPSNTSIFRDKTARHSFLVLGNTRRLKNMIGVAKALVTYKYKYGDVPEVHWVGRISHNHRDYKMLDESRRLLKKHKLEDRLKLLGEQHKIFDLIHKHDALILASFYEGLPNVICEAFASGKPVLASNVCENRKIIKPGINGFLFDPVCPNEIAHVIYKYITLDIQKKRTMGINARLFAEEHFSLDKYVVSYEKLFYEITAPSM